MFNLVLNFLIIPYIFCSFNTAKYCDLRENYPRFTTPMGEVAKGEITFVFDEDGVNEIRQSNYERLRHEGITADFADKWTRVGIVAQDKKLLWIRDAVVFPGGDKGLANRFMFRSTLSGEVEPAYLCSNKKGEIYLNISFSHATRAWEASLPRDVEGAVVAKRLGQYNPDPSLFGSYIPVLFTEVDRLDETTYTAFSHQEIDEALQRGFVEVSVKGETKTVLFQDGMIPYALYLAMLKGWLR